MDVHDGRPLLFMFRCAHIRHRLVRLSSHTDAHMAKNLHLSVRLPAPVKRALAKEAEADHRSITSLILKILSDRTKSAAPQQQAAE